MAGELADWAELQHCRLLGMHWLAGIVAGVPPGAAAARRVTEDATRRANMKVNIVVEELARVERLMKMFDYWRLCMQKMALYIFRRLSMCVCCGTIRHVRVYSVVLHQKSNKLQED